MKQSEPKSTIVKPLLSKPHPSAGSQITARETIFKNLPETITEHNYAPDNDAMYTLKLL